MDAASPIGVFDSGIGGLTVLRALRTLLPEERLIYLGDTARLPYGAKSAETVIRYATQTTAALVARGVKLAVVACNTASAAALPVLQAAFAPVPIVGVVEPGARAALTVTRTGRIGVLATEGTVRGGAYVRALQALGPAVQVQQAACPLFVALAEEGWTSGEVPRLAAERYVRPLLGPEGADTLILGCTHFPLLAPAIASVAGPGVALVDGALMAAQETQAILHARRALRSGASLPVRFLATDSPERFARVGAAFLGAPIDPAQVELIDLGA
jgi:glutamate racemase